MIVKLCLAGVCAQNAEHQQDLSDFSNTTKVSLSKYASSGMILLAGFKIF